MAELALEMLNITKEFPGVVALDDVSFSCRMGEIHALVGENGAGKSTLMKILAGVYHPDRGEIRLKGQPVRLSNPSEAQRMGIGIIYQEFNLLPWLTVVENILLGALGSAWWIGRALVRRRSERWTGWGSVSTCGPGSST